MFRVIAFNKYGISLPAKSADEITTPSKRYLEFGYLQTKPFYREPWFLVALAAASIVIIIMVVAILCVKSKSYKYKDQAKQQHIDDGGNTVLDDTTTTPGSNYVTLEMRQSRRGTLKSQGRGTMRSTASRRSHARSNGHPAGHHSNSNGTLISAASASSNFAMIGSRAPPRPAPSMVRYSDEDDDSAKGYDENPDDSDSLTEKPSEISSSTSSQGTESEQESTGGSGDPMHSFVSHYENVGSTFRQQSWKKQKQKAIAVPTPRAGNVGSNSNTLGRGAAGAAGGTGTSGGSGGGGGGHHQHHQQQQQQ